MTHKDVKTMKPNGFINRLQGRSQNLKEVPQNITEAFNVDDVTANDVIRRKQHPKEKN